eukprot:COSAG01_NODE_7594_length_3134_cov_5.924547_6_plen_48_part_00
MKEMTGSMPAYSPAQEKAKREQREAVLQVSDPSYVPRTTIRKRALIS